jgi:ElaB/YqjD/DUF883 family membrane-anchored ribosome-binding protein
MATRKDDLEAAAAETAEPLASEVAALRQDLGELGAIVARIGKDRARGLKAAAGATAAEGYAKGGAAYEAAIAELQSLEDELAAAARRRPFASMGLAALVGFLLGVLFRR